MKGFVNRQQRLPVLRMIVVVPLTIALVCMVSLVLAQYTIPWWTQEGGGGYVAGSTYRVHTAVSQPDAGNSTVGAYTDYGGYLGGLTIGPPSATILYTFGSTAQGWTFAGTVGSYATPGTTSTGGHIGLTPSGSTNCFSYWYSPSITIQDNKYYRSRWKVASNAASNEAVQCRLRVNQIGSWQAWDRIINSNLSTAPYSANPRYFTSYFNPDVTGSGDNSVQLSFDILSFDTSDNESSWLYLEECWVEEVAITAGTDVAYYPFTSSAEGWSFAGAVPGFAVPGTWSADSHLGLNPLGSTNCFSYWYSPDIAMSRTRPYRAQFTMKSSVANPDDAVQCRLRVNQKGAWHAWDRVINSNNSQGPSSGASKNYNVIIEPLVDSSSNDVVMSFDILSFDINDNETSWLYLETARFEEVAINP